MKKLKRFLIALSAVLVPAAAHSFLIALLVGLGVTFGFEVFRTIFPVNMRGALTFFSQCWSCQIFSDIFTTLSGFIPKIYDAIGAVTIPMAIGLTLVWFVWMILSDYIKIRPVTDPWKIASNWVTHFVKLSFVILLLTFPLPRMVTQTFIEPIVNVGLSYNGITMDRVDPTENNFTLCLISSSLQNPAVSSEQAFSPKLRDNLMCQITRFHQLTGLGMTVGWTFLNMAFNLKYAHFHILPNIGFILAGFFIWVAFLFALLPIPLYFLEMFIGLAFDLVMLPLSLLGWLFASSNWKIFPSGANGNNVMEIVKGMVKKTVGIALVGLFTGFVILFLDRVIGDMDSVSGLVEAIQQNNSDYMIQALQFNNQGFTGMINLIFYGIFIGMFMNGIPALIKKLFNNENIMGTQKLQDKISGYIKKTQKYVVGKVKSISGADAGGEK